MVTLERAACQAGVGRLKFQYQLSLLRMTCSSRRLVSAALAVPLICESAWKYLPLSGTITRVVDGGGMNLNRREPQEASPLAILSEALDFMT